ncbi:signal recognition particle receptor subunit beta-like [Acanthaster planci]|uniref:Signal recognition particle receptor subunit beta n=1 Tax=Acanthaster planci TaxID=133434 RepID=A0A8B7YB81_ACAPL|nr:signal recognition particle receptor subunit beta-like [Acanthaster planci]
MEVERRRVDTFEGTFQALKNEIAKQDPTVLGVVVAVVVVLITVAFLYLLARRKNNKRSVLLMGICDAGKTLLFSRLVHNKFINSFTSIKENSGVYQLTGRKSGTLEVVDLPGNDRQRMIFWERFKNQARGLIFVVDSAAFQNELKEVAEFLYTLLSDCMASRTKLSVLITCNKQDAAMAKSSKVIRDKLEKEINTLRVTRSASLGSTDGSAGSEAFLGARGKDFGFAQLSPVSVEFAECSAKGNNEEDGQADLNAVEEWIHSIA